MSLLAIPHPDNGRRCICDHPVYLTPNGWKTRDDKGSHPQPPSRRIAQTFEQHATGHARRRTQGDG